MVQGDELDRLLDCALATYSDAEPLAGIEERVMRRVAGARQLPWLWWLAGAVPVAACLLLLLTSREAVAPPQRPVEVTQAPIVGRAILPAAGFSAGALPERRRRPRFTAPQGVAKRDQFPVATPLTVEEQRLLQLVAVAPEALQPAPLTAIEIEPIQIKPLDLGGTN